MTHPFHPLHGRSFTVVTIRRGWTEDRVWFHQPDGTPRSLPLAWTDQAIPDPHQTVGRGRARFRIGDLFELAQVIKEARP